MNIPFPHEICPLCNKAMKPNPWYGYLECPTSIDMPGALPHSHYFLSFVNKDVEPPTILQHMIVDHYRICTQNNNWKSYIYKAKVLNNGSLEWKSIFHCPKIHADTPERLLERIKRLIIVI
jgi:hypothetical protein